MLAKIFQTSILSYANELEAQSRLIKISKPLSCRILTHLGRHKAMRPRKKPDKASAGWAILFFWALGVHPGSTKNPFSLSKRTNMHSSYLATANFEREIAV